MKYNAILLTFIMLTSGCVATTNRKIEMKNSDSSIWWRNKTVAPINSPTVSELDYFDHNAVKWPSKKKSEKNLPKPNLYY